MVAELETQCLGNFGHFYFWVYNVIMLWQRKTTITLSSIHAQVNHPRKSPTLQVRVTSDFTSNTWGDLTLHCGEQ